MRKIKEVIIAMAGLVLPLGALAAGTGTLYNNIKSVINAVIYILFALMALYFFWGIFQLVSAGGDEKKVASGKQHMIWGILGIVVAAALWGIVAIVAEFLGINTGGTLPGNIIPGI